MQEVILFLAKEEMKLRDDDKAWLSEEIARQLDVIVDSFKPHGLRRLVHKLREIGPLATVISIFITLFGIAAGAIYFGVSEVGKNSEFRGSTTQRLKTIEDRIVEINKSILAIRIGQVASDPISKQNAQDAKQILQSAKRSSIQLPVNLVEQSGKGFIKAAAKEPEAWDAALRFAEYRSYLNAFAASPVVETTKTTTTIYTVTSPHGEVGPTLSVAGTLSVAKAARYNFIGEELKTNTEFGNAFIVATAGGAILDNYELRNVVFQNAHIVYHGGPIQMTNVYFINCTFDFAPATNSKQIAAAILSAPSVSLALS